jgi:hypothetical protein
MVLPIFNALNLSMCTAWSPPSCIQVVAAYMMSQTLIEKGYDAFAFSIPSGKEFMSILSLSAPVFVTLTLKVDKVFCYICGSLSRVVTFKYN